MEKQLDVGRFLRLREAIGAVLKSIPEKSSVTSGDAFPKAYERLRGEVEGIIADNKKAEFERLSAVVSSECCREYARRFRSFEGRFDNQRSPGSLGTARGMAAASLPRSG